MVETLVKKNELGFLNVIVQPNLTLKEHVKLVENKRMSKFGNRGNGSLRTK